MRESLTWASEHQASSQSLEPHIIPVEAHLCPSKAQQQDLYVLNSSASNRCDSLCHIYVWQPLSLEIPNSTEHTSTSTIKTISAFQRHLSLFYVSSLFPSCFHFQHEEWTELAYDTQGMFGKVNKQLKVIMWISKWCICIAGDY